MMSSQWHQPLNAGDHLPCYNTDIVTRCSFKILYKHHATWVLVIQKIKARLRQESSKVMEWSWALSFKWHAIPRYSQDNGIHNLTCLFTLLGLYYSTSQSLKGRQTEKYSIKYLIRWNGQGIRDLDHPCRKPNQMPSCYVHACNGTSKQSVSAVIYIYPSVSYTPPFNV